MPLEYNKATDSDHEVQLTPSLVSAYWLSKSAPVEGLALFQINSAFVGQLAPIKVELCNGAGKKIGKIKGKIRNNCFKGAFTVPENLQIDDVVTFEFSMKGNAIDGQSEAIPVVPRISVPSMSWSAKEARRKDVLTLSAFVDGVRDGQEVTLTIYEYDQDSAHDLIVELPGTVEGGRVDVMWEYEYHEDTDEIATDKEMKKYGGKYNAPEYFFTVKVDSNEYGKEQESGLLLFKDWVEIVLVDANGDPLSDKEYILELPDGSERKGTVDSNGCAIEENIPPGKITIRFAEFDNVNFSDASE